MARRKSKPAATEMEVRWRPGSRFSAIPVEKVQSEIERIKNPDGEVTAEDVLTYASKHPRSALYKAIGDWDDSSAARKWRMAQSRLIIRSIEVREVEGQKIPTRAYEVDRTKWKPRESAGKPYRSTADIMKDPAAKADLLNRALAELCAFQRRYRGLQELAILMRNIDEFLEEFHEAK